MTNQITVRFVPQWRGSIEGYTVKTIRYMLPIVHDCYDFDDLFHEAFEVYLRCKQRYASKIDNAAWFMALYKRCWATHSVNLIRKTKLLSMHCELIDDENIFGTDVPDSQLLLMLMSLDKGFQKMICAMVLPPYKLPARHIEKLHKCMDDLLLSDN